MYSKVLVPLDGSQFAEQALPHAQSITAGGPLEIHLLSVAPALEEQALSAVDMYPVYVYREYTVDYGSETERIRADLQDYLNQVAKRFQSSGQVVIKAIRFGQPAEEIITYAHENGCDLIVMSTHGRSGLGRWVYGSIADKILRGSTTPVLLVRVKQTV